MVSSREKSLMTVRLLEFSFGNPIKFVAAVSRLFVVFQGITNVICQVAQRPCWKEAVR